MVLKLPMLEGLADRQVVTAIEMLRRALETPHTDTQAVKQEVINTLRSGSTLAMISSALSGGGSHPVIITNNLGGLPKSPGDARTFLNGASKPTFARVRDRDLLLADIVTNDATDGRHGFLPKLPGTATVFLNGEGEWVEIEPAVDPLWVWAPVTNGDALSPEILFDSNGEVVLGLEYVGP